MDPLQHYLWLGARMGRSPSPGFDLAAYLRRHPEAAEFNPLLHQVRRLKDRLGETPAGPALLPPWLDPAQNEGRHRIKIAVIAWDVGHNPLGRAYLIAEALSRRFETILIGPQFPRYGKSVWTPVRDGRLPVISFPGTSYPEFGDQLDRLAQRLDCDVIVACKPRMPSLQLALTAKQVLNRPLILDIDDHELAFAGDFSPLSLRELGARPASDLQDPYSGGWTRFAQSLIPLADAIITSNEALQGEFGGSIVPHARDETVFDPALYDVAQCRAELGLRTNERVVLFAGTARPHKGVVELARAVSAAHADTRLAIVGDILDRGFRAEIERAGGGRVIFLPNQPLGRLPRFLAAADLVCLPQAEGGNIGRFQLPAKLIDALAMGIPVLATPTPPLREFIEAGIVTAAGPDRLAEDIETAFHKIDTLKRRQAANRQLFLDRYSYSAAARTLETLVLSTIGQPRRLPPEALSFRALQNSTTPPEPAAPQVPAVNASGTYDIVLFWKQNDTGIYGRRSDMLARYLARHPDVRKVLVLDAPLWSGDLNKRLDGSGKDEHRLVWQETTAHNLGLRDVGNLSFETAIFHPARRHPHARWTYPTRETYLDWVRSALSRHGIGLERSIFWTFPVNFQLPEIVNALRPRLVVTDIVDDQREHPSLKPERRELLERNYEAMLALSDLAVTNCEPLRQSMSRFAPGIRLLPNASELTEATPAASMDLSRLDAIPRPRLGYVGNLESKLDLDLLERIARSRPEWNIVLIGSGHTNPAVARLQGHKNIHMMGVVPYEEAKAWVQQLDVALLPHLHTKLTESMNPLKIFVYLAQRIPVVATRVPNIDEFADFIRIADTHEEFIAGIEQALARGRLDRDSALDAKLAEHSWQARVDQAMEWIESLVARKRSPTARAG